MSVASGSATSPATSWVAVGCVALLGCHRPGLRQPYLISLFEKEPITHREPKRSFLEELQEFHEKAEVLKEIQNSLYEEDWTELKPILKFVL